MEDVILRVGIHALVPRDRCRAGRRQRRRKVCRGDEGWMTGRATRVYREAEVDEGGRDKRWMEEQSTAGWETGKKKGRAGGGVRITRRRILIRTRRSIRMRIRRKRVDHKERREGDRMMRWNVNICAGESMYALEHGCMKRQVGKTSRR